VRTKLEPLLCELHAHTTWSDGVLTTRELVDLYGRSGFDVLCVTDHVSRTDDPWLADGEPPRGVRAEAFAAYREELELEAARARSLYGMLVLPGLELTYNELDPALAAHALAIGLREFVGVDDGLEQALRDARQSGAALVAAHPVRSTCPRSGPVEGVGGNREVSPAPTARQTFRFARDWRSLRPLVDRWELFNRSELFAWVAEAGLPGIATGDFHRPEHLPGWKTLLPCVADEDAVVGYLRSPLPVFLARLDRSAAEERAA
jgi:3',5'-nucleoside bisphosphate phosphatase